MNSNYKCRECGKDITSYEHIFMNDICFGCTRRQNAEKQAVALRENEETETYCEDNIICPYCGYAIEDDDGYYASHSDGEEECPECGKTFNWQAEVSVTYSTQRIEEEEYE